MPAEIVCLIMLEEDQSFSVQMPKTLTIPQIEDVIAAALFNAIEMGASVDSVLKRVGDFRTRSIGSAPEPMVIA